MEKNKKIEAEELPNIEEGRPLPSFLLDVSERPDEDYVPEGFESVDDFLQDMRENYDADVDFDQENRHEAYEDKKFAAGEHWDPAVLELRKGLPCLTIDTIPQFTAQVVGDWRESRSAVKVLPTEDGDTDIANIRGDLIRAIELQSRANRVYDDAFESMIICGDGAFRVAVEYAGDDVFDQDIFIRPITDSLAVVWDRLSVDPTGRDARRVFVDDRLPRKEFDRQWPGEDGSLLNDRDITQYRSQGWFDDDSVRVTEYWRMIERDRTLVLFEDGSTRFYDEAGDLEQLIATHGQPVRARVAPCRYAQMHLVTATCILAGPYEYRLDRLPIIRMTGRVTDIAGRRVRKGMVRAMKDPARLRDFWRSVAAEQLGYAPKAQWIATESAVEGYEDSLRKAHLSRDPLLKVSDEAIIGQNIQRLDPVPIQAAVLQEAMTNAQDMKDVTGIHDASLGIRSNEVSGKAIQARQKEGDIASLTYFDNGNEAILEGGDVINQLISQIYDGTRILRVIGEDEAPRFQKVNDPFDPSSPNLATGKYDVALSTGTSYATRRAYAADAMMQAVQVWPQLLSVAGDLVAKAQDWPGAEDLAERLKKTIPPHLLSEEERENGEGGLPPEMQEQLMQLQTRMQELEQENMRLETEVKDKAEKLEIDRYNAVTQRLRALSDDEADVNKQTMDYMKMVMDQNSVASPKTSSAPAGTPSPQGAPEQGDLPLTPPVTRPPEGPGAPPPLTIGPDTQP